MGMKKPAGDQPAGLTTFASPARVRQHSDRTRWFGNAKYSGRRGGTRSTADDWPVYDVDDLGLQAHDRKSCASCRAVGK